MEHKDHQQANDKTAAPYALARAINFLIRILSRLLRAIGPSKIVLVDKIKASEDWRAQAFLLERRWPNEQDFERGNLLGMETDLAQLRLDRFGMRTRCIATFRARS
jgi:hypothetical protein